MWNQTIIALVLFEAYYWAINWLSNGALTEPNLLLLNIAFAGWLAMEALRVRLGHKANSKTFGLLSRMFLLVSFFSILFALFDKALLNNNLGLWLPDNSFFPGLALLLLGVYLRHTSIKTLGKFFVTKVQVTDDHELVKEGIYSLLRHPSYTGLIVGFFGALLMAGSGIALLVFIFIGIPSYLYRIWVEERALISVFGDKYTEYKSSTYAIFPYVY